MRRTSAILSAAFVLALAAGARAESPSELDELLGQAIVSTPSKGSETDTTAPATSTVITADELRRYGIRTLDEAINYLSLGMMTSTSLHANEIGARGVQIYGDYGNHVLLLIDGHAQNEPWNGTAYFDRGAGVPFEMIDHIEVMLGPGSVLYGSQAMLGVINIVTKRAKDFQGARVIAETDTAFSDGGGGTPGFGYRLGAGYGREFSIGSSPSEFTLGLEYYKNEGPNWQVGPQYYGEDYVTYAPKNFGPRAQPGVWGGQIKDADYVEVPAAYARFSTGDFRASLRASAFRRSMVYADGLAGSTGDFDDPYNREIDRFANLDLSQRIPVSSSVELVAHAYGDLYDYRWYNRSSAAEDCPYGYLEGCDRFLEGVGRSLGGELRAQFQWPVLRASTLLGVDGKVRDVHDNATIEGAIGDPVAPLGGERVDGLIAPYIAQTFGPWRWLDLNLGLRLDHDTRFGNKLSPRTALGVVPWEAGRIKLIYAEAFRGPSAYELTYSDPNWQIPASDLGPESVRSAEASFEQRFGKHRLLFGVFRSWWSGLVGSRRLTGPELEAAIAAGQLTEGLEEGYVRANLGQIDNYGLNAGYEGAADKGRLRFGLNYTAATTRMDPGDGSGSLPIIVAPQTFGNARIAYDLPQALPTLGLAARFSDSRLANRYYDGAFEPKPIAPPLFAFRLTASGEIPELERLRYRVGGEYSFAKGEPYTVGGGLYGNANVTQGELAHVRRAQLFVGLEYAFEASPAAGTSY
ncbi:MAG TPA: TonB-dependent receptor plug domain-containing protein [Polyangiaceae bacterium]